MTIERFGIWVSELDRVKGGFPLGYGAAWASPYSNRVFCMRVPFNRIVGAFRAWFLEWRRPCPDDPIMLARQVGYDEGYQRGKDAGFESGIRMALDIVRVEMKP